MRTSAPGCRGLSRLDLFESPQRCRPAAAAAPHPIEPAKAAAQGIKIDLYQPCEAHEVLRYHCADAARQYLFQE